MKMGVSRAEAQTTAAVQSGDRVLIQRFTNFTAQNNVWVPLESTVDEIAAFALGGTMVQAVGKVTMVGGTATVAVPAITAGSVVLLTEANAAPNSLGYVITPGTGFVIHSSSGADTSSVSYLVLS
jgi:hypothetical protein